jgi:hypothetical protein
LRISAQSSRVRYNVIGISNQSSRLRSIALLAALTAVNACGSDGNPREDAAVSETGGDRPSIQDAPDATDVADGADGKDARDGGACQPPLTQDGTCNSIALRGATVGSTCSAAPIPSPGGGAIEDGTYVLDAMTFYGTCPANAAHQRTNWIICGGSWQAVEEIERIAGSPDAGLVTERVGVSMMLQSTSAAGDVSCWFAPGTAPTRVSWGYDAAAGRLSLYIPIAPGVRVDSFIRQ